jgi:hypothetical protein
MVDALGQRRGHPSPRAAVRSGHTSRDRGQIVAIGHHETFSRAADQRSFNVVSDPRSVVQLNRSGHLSALIDALALWHRGPRIQMMADD